MSTPPYDCIATNTRNLLLLYVRGLCWTSDTGKTTAFLEVVMDSACSDDGETEMLQKWLMKPTWGGQNCFKIVFKIEVSSLRILLQGSYSHGVRDSLGYYTTVYNS